MIVVDPVGVLGVEAVFGLCFSIQYLVSFCFAIISPGKIAGCFTLIAL